MSLPGFKIKNIPVIPRITAVHRNTPTLFFRIGIERIVTKIGVANDKAVAVANSK